MRDRKRIAQVHVPHVRRVGERAFGRDNVVHDSRMSVLLPCKAPCHATQVPEDHESEDEPEDHAGRYAAD